MPITKYYKEHYTPHQLVLPFDLGILIPKNNEVITYCELMRGVNLEKYLKLGSNKGRKPKNRVAILNTILFGFMTGVRSSRNIESACKVDIRFMYLLGDEKAPSHTTINNTINELTHNIDEVFLDVLNAIRQYDEIDMNVAFVDGTKIEADANRYSFVWRKSVEKNQVKLNYKITNLLIYIKEVYPTSFFDFTIKEKYSSNDLKKVQQVLQNQIELDGINIVEGKGTRKSVIQKFYELITQYTLKMEEYEYHLSIFGPNRNSYAKTDHDATFMRMKTDHMQNGQLKPGYNVQLAVSEEYITLVDVFQERSDQPTFIPFMEKYRELHGFLPTYPVADAGYGGYDNYHFCLENNIELYQKYTLWEKERSTKYKKDPFKKHNYKKDEQGNYICPNNKKFHFVRAYSSTRLKNENEIFEYVCDDCSDCSFKSKCTKSQGNKTITENKLLEQMKNTVNENLNSELGIHLRVQRSIQVEGAFGVIKEDMKFSRFTRTSMKSVKLEITLMCIGYNLKKYHNKKFRSHILLN